MSLVRGVIRIVLTSVIVSQLQAIVQYAIVQGDMLPCWKGLIVVRLGCDGLWIKNQQQQKPHELTVVCEACRSLTVLIIVTDVQAEHLPVLFSFFLSCLLFYL